MGNNHLTWQLTLFLKVSQGHKPKERLIKVSGELRSKAGEDSGERNKEKIIYKCILGLSEITKALTPSNSQLD